MERVSLRTLGTKRTGCAKNNIRRDIRKDGLGEFFLKSCDMDFVSSKNGAQSRLLAEALEHKVITKYTRDRLTFYAPAPF